MQRLAVISREDAQEPSPSAVISALVSAGFSDHAKTPSETDLAGVVQTEIAERLMILATNSDATPEVQSAALAGVRSVQDAIKKDAVKNGLATDAVLGRVDHEITLFLQNPQQNTPKLKPPGAPAGPPV
jgi:hypothetical protein